MGKLKIAGAVLLTLALLFAGASIPWLTAWFMDGLYTQKGSMSPMTSIELQIHQDTPSIGKLAMMSRMDGNLAIKENKASMTQQEVLQAVESGLRPYIDAHLVSYAETDIQMQPRLAQVQSEPELQGVFWIVTVSGDSPDYSFIDLVLDDETGKILRISYHSEKQRTANSNAEALGILTDIFFSGLGIEEYQESASSDLNGVYVGDNAQAMRFRFGDKQYGEVNVDLYVYDGGFYVELPKN